MPIGSYALTPHIAQHLLEHAPRRVLDVGVGFGYYGAVVRQWLDLGVKPYRTELFGVEVWADYRNPLWDLYDVIFVETIERFLERPHSHFDCVIITDVIEHFARPPGSALIAALKERVGPGGHLVIGTPAEFRLQGPVYGNPWEQHRSLWTEEDFRKLGFQAGVVGQKHWFCGEAILAIWRRS
jgi:SAM-dependent methyltransferase